MAGERLALALACMAALALSSNASAQVATPSMIGRWKGDAQIAVNWTKARTLPVEIVIAADDRVTGTVGNAALVDGRFSRNRGWITRRLDWKTDYIIDAKLQGPVIAAEGIERESVRIPLNWTSGHFEGGVNTSGSKIGDAQSMILAAGKLVLHRVPDLIICRRAGVRPDTGC